MKSQRGSSLTEMMMVVAVLALVAAGVASFFSMAGRNLVKSENRTDLIRLTQRARDNLRQVVETSQMMLVDSASPAVDLGDYQARIRTGILTSPSKAPNPVNFSGMPTVTDTPKVDSSLASSFGNQLMMAVAVSPLNLSVQTQASPLIRQDVSLDRYQFAAVYIGANPSQKPAGFPGAAAGLMQLVHWRSIPYVSYNQLARFTGPKKDEVCKALAARGYTLAWNVGVTSTAAAFHTIQASAPFLVTTPSPPPGFFPEHSWGLLTEYEKNLSYRPDPLKPLGRVRGADQAGGVSGFPSRYGVAYNNSTATASPAHRVNALFGDYSASLQVPLFAVPDRAGPGFPGGFEVLVLGQPGARELWARITLMASSGADQQLSAKAPKTFMSKAETAYVSFVDAF